MNKRKTDGLVSFPDPALLPEESDGLVYIGGALNVENLVGAYSRGIFPWPLEESYPLFWFCPQPRGVLDFQDLHVPRSLARFRRRCGLQATVNSAFRQVVEECSRQPRPGQEGTWIVPAMIPAYEELHRQGFAHSVEIWRGSALVGGLYGVCVKGVFSGESMFHLEPNTSKLALLEAVERLAARGLRWMDIQMLTPVTEQLGGHYISRRDFLERLAQAHRCNPPLRLSWTS